MHLSISGSTFRRLTEKNDISPKAHCDQEKGFHCLTTSFNFKKDEIFIQPSESPQVQWNVSYMIRFL